MKRKSIDTSILGEVVLNPEDIKRGVSDISEKLNSEFNEAVIITMES